MGKRFLLFVFLFSMSWGAYVNMGRYVVDKLLQLLVVSGYPYVLLPAPGILSL